MTLKQIAIHILLTLVVFNIFSTVTTFSTVISAGAQEQCTTEELLDILPDDTVTGTITATGNCDEYIQELGAKAEAIKTKEDILEMVFGHIDRSMPNGITWSDLLNKTKVLTADLRKLVNTLAAQDRVVAIKETTKGRERTIVKVKGWENV